jgi:hypothetical protein
MKEPTLPHDILIGFLTNANVGAWK